MSDEALRVLAFAYSPYGGKLTEEGLIFGFYNHIFMLGRNARKHPAIFNRPVALLRAKRVKLLARHHLGSVPRNIQLLGYCERPSCLLPPSGK